MSDEIFDDFNDKAVGLKLDPTKADKDKLRRIFGAKTMDELISIDSMFQKLEEPTESFVAVVRANNSAPTSSEKPKFRDDVLKRASGTLESLVGGFPMGMNPLASRTERGRKYVGEHNLENGIDKKADGAASAIAKRSTFFWMWMKARSVSKDPEIKRENEKRFVRKVAIPEKLITSMLLPIKSVMISDKSSELSSESQGYKDEVEIKGAIAAWLCGELSWFAVYKILELDTYDRLCQLDLFSSLVTQNLPVYKMTGGAGLFTECTSYFSIALVWSFIKWSKSNSMGVLTSPKQRMLSKILGRELAEPLEKGLRDARLKVSKRRTAKFEDIKRSQFSKNFKGDNKNKDVIKKYLEDAKKEMMAMVKDEV